MKKRIFAASMASVMALSSVSVVAFADETKADFGEAVTKAELKEYVKTAEKFAEDKLDDYGSVQSEQFEAALEAAKVVASDSDATDEEVVAVYQMLKAVENSLQMYTQAQLKELVNDCKSKYDTKNILNEDFGDLIYTEKSFTAFESAYDTAEGCLEEDDQRVLNDAYTELYNAEKNLTAKDSVTKAQFRSAYNAYIDLVNKFDNYETWRRGKATVGVKTGELKDDANNKLDFADTTVTYAVLKDIVYGKSTAIPAAMKKKTYGSGTWIKFTPVKSGTTDVRDAVEENYDKFIGNETSNTTTNDSILQAYNACLDAVKVFNGWQVDNIKRGSKTACYDLINSYRGDILPVIYKDDTQATVAALKTDLTGQETNVVLTVKDGKAEIDASACAKDVKFYISKDTNALTLDADKKTYKADATATEKTVQKGGKLDITKYLPINATIVGTTLDAGCLDTTNTMSVAYKAFEAVVALDENTTLTEKDYSDTGVIPASINDNGAVTKTSLKSVAYPLVYRAMAYALADNFTHDAEYKKSDVAALVKKSNDLIDATGDAAMFQVNNAALDKARKAATEWVAKANATKGYKDGQTVSYNDGKYDDGVITGATGHEVNATAVYKALNSAYKALNDQFAQYPYSYGDVAETIATVSEGIDANAYGASAADLKAAVESIAYDLATIDEFKVTENVIFDDDSNFIAYNRLDSKGTDAEKALYKKYVALLKAVEDAGKSDVTKGDVDGDGVVSALDALAALKFTVGKITLTDAQKAAADVDGDGEVSVLDALAILKSTVSQG